MTNYSYDGINKKTLIVLKVDDSGKFYTDYLPIPIDSNLSDSISDSIETLQSNLREKIGGNILSEEEIYLIKKQMLLDWWHNIQSEYSYLLGYRDYCSEVSLPYNSVPGISSNFKMEFKPFSQEDCICNDYNTTDYNTTKKIFVLDEDVFLNLPMVRDKDGNYTKIESLFSDSFFDSYFIEQAYKECQNNSNVKAYSHRRLGWKKYNFVLNDIFSVDINTNFGYGTASYFCVTLIFDKIQIIPYSRLVKYRHANYIQFIRNTWNFSVEDDSWELALNMVRDACNCYQQNRQNNFVKRYFIDELEFLTSKLSEYVKYKNDNIYETVEVELSEKEYGNYINREEKNKTVELKDFPLIIFRAEKILGAVGFVESIKKINKIFPTQKYIDIIIDCCRKVLPQSNKAIEDLNRIISDLEKEYKKECEKRDKYKQVYEDYKSKWEKIEKSYQDAEQKMREEIYTTKNNDCASKNSQVITELLFKKMGEKYPDWTRINWTRIRHDVFSLEKQKFDQQNLCLKLYQKIDHYQIWVNSISGYKNKIESFIENER